MRQQFGNTAEFANSLFEDRRTQKQLRIIVDGLEALHHEYNQDGTVHQQGPDACLRWQAERSMGAWYKTIGEMVELLHSHQMIHRLGLRPQPANRQQPPLAPGDPAVAEDAALVLQMFHFIVDLSANRAWSQSFHMFVFPYCTACLLCPEAGRVQTRMRSLAKALLKLEDFVAALPTGGRKKHPTAKLYESIGTSDWQIVRELLHAGQKADWNPQDQELHALVVALFRGSASTREPLERPFGWLKDSLRASKSSRVSVWTRWAYLLVNPYPRDGGMPQIFPSPADFQQLLRDGFQDEALLNASPFNPLATSLGDAFPTPDQVEGVRPAGYMANRAAAAAMALATASSAHNFENIENAWAGLSRLRWCLF